MSPTRRIRPSSTSRCLHRRRHYAPCGAIVKGRLAGAAVPHPWRRVWGGWTFGGWRFAGLMAAASGARPGGAGDGADRVEIRRLVFAGDGGPDPEGPKGGEEWGRS